MTTTTNTTIGSTLVGALENVWTAIRQRHPELPEVIIITGSGTDMLGLKWGHYWHHGWSNGRFIATADGVIERERKPELFVSGETLGVGAVKTVQTLLHEATHALAAAREIKDTSRQHRYHNRRFRDLAEELGLTYPHERPDRTIGYSAVEITEATLKEYAEEIDQLATAITATLELPGWAARLLGGGKGTGTDGGDKVTGQPRRKRGGGRSTSLAKATCGCEPARIIRVARSTLEQAPITCGACGAGFSVDGEPAPAGPATTGGTGQDQPTEPAPQPEPDIEVTRVVELSGKAGHKVTVDLIGERGRYRYEVTGPSGYRAVLPHCGCDRPGCGRCDVAGVTGFAEKVLATYTGRRRTARPTGPARPDSRHLAQLDGEEAVMLHRIRLPIGGPGEYRLVCLSHRHEGGRYEQLIEQDGPHSDEPQRAKAEHIRWHRETFGVSGRVLLDRWIARNAHVAPPEVDRVKLDRQLATARAERDATRSG